MGCLPEKQVIQKIYVVLACMFTLILLAETMHAKTVQQKCLWMAYSNEIFPRIIILGKVMIRTVSYLHKLHNNIGFELNMFEKYYSNRLLNRHTAQAITQCQLPNAIKHMLTIQSFKEWHVFITKKCIYIVKCRKENAPSDRYLSNLMVLSLMLESFTIFFLLQACKAKLITYTNTKNNWTAREHMKICFTFNALL